MAGVTGVATLDPVGDCTLLLFFLFVGLLFDENADVRSAVIDVFDPPIRMVDTRSTAALAIYNDISQPLQFRDVESIPSWATAVLCHADLIAYVWFSFFNLISCQEWYIYHRDTAS